MFINSKFSKDTPKENDLWVFLHTQRTAGSAFRTEVLEHFTQEKKFALLLMDI